MKTYINNSYKVKVLTLILAGMFFACSDLEENPVGLLSPEGFFKSKKDVETAVFGAYGWIASEPLYGRQFTTALMLRSDMVDIGDRGTPAARQQVNDFNMDSNNGMVASFWPYWYQVISAANSAISGAESLGLDEAAINPLIAEARFVRAFSYFHLVQIFGDIPFIDYFITNPELVKEISKTPAAQVYESILADLAFAKEWLPDNQPGSTRSRATKGTAASYLASVYLTLGDFQKSYTEAKWVIDNKDRFGYRLEADFQDLYRAEKALTLKEPIFTLDFLGLKNGGGGANVDYHGSMTGIRGSDIAGWSVAVPSMNVYNTWDDNDYRKTVSFDATTPIKGVVKPYTEFANTKRPHIAKYRRFPGTAVAEGGFSDHNYIAFRYAEVLLTAAEALAEVNGGPNAEAEGYVNQVLARARNAAGTPSAFPADIPSGLSKSEFIDAVLNERRLELAFEFKRWYDLKRRNLGEAAFKGPNALEPHANFDATRDYLMPLPRTELDVNPNLRPQNPGY